MARVLLLLALATCHIQFLGAVPALPRTDDQQVLLDSPQYVEDVYQVRDELKKADIIPTVIDEFLPSLLVDAEWSSSSYAQLGNTLKPKKLQDEPSITLTRPSSSSGHCNSVANITYTIAITDPDAPSRDSPKWSEFCHWVATGLSVSSDSESSCSSLSLSLSLSPSLSLTALEDVMPYYPPGPPEKTGKHRYVFLVFAPANGTTQPLNLTKPGDRQHWGYKYDGERVGVRRWSEENGLVPVAANFVYSQNGKQ